MIDTRLHRRLVSGVRAALVAAAALAWTIAPRAQATTYVTLCGADSDPGSGINLNAALAAGGHIGFNCPAGSAIRITSAKLLTSAISIDGLSGGRPIRLLNAIAAAPPAVPFVFQVMPGGSLDVVDLEIDTWVPTAGGISSQGTLRVAGVFFNGLYVGLGVDRGDATVLNSRFTGNNLSLTVGLPARHVRISTSDFRGNSRGVAVSGGLPGFAIPPDRSHVIDRSVFSDNATAVQHCAAADCAAPFELTIANSLIVNSRDTSAAVRGRTIRLVNSTLAANRGVGIASDPGAMVTLVNTIVAGSGRGNCQGSISAGGPNLQYPASTCGAAAVADPRLTDRLEPGSDSPAIGAGNTAACASPAVNKIDYYGTVRLASGTCSIGGVEKPLEHPPVLPPLLQHRG